MTKKQTKQIDKSKPEMMRIVQDKLTAAMYTDASSPAPKGLRFSISDATTILSKSLHGAEEKDLVIDMLMKRYMQALHDIDDMECRRLNSIKIADTEVKLHAAAIQKLDDMIREKDRRLDNQMATISAMGAEVKDLRRNMAVTKDAYLDIILGITQRMGDL